MQSVMSSSVFAQLLVNAERDVLLCVRAGVGECRA
jgi:hypothetical protein